MSDEQEDGWEQEPAAPVAAVKFAADFEIVAGVVVVASIVGFESVHELTDDDH